MGNAVSAQRIRKDVENNTINENDLKTINKSMSKSSAETNISAAKACGAKMNLAQSCMVGDVAVSGPGAVVNLSATQKQTGQLSFKCTNSTDVQQTMATDMSRTITDTLKENIGVDSFAKLETKAVAKAEASLGGGSSASILDVEDKVINNVTNITRKTLENIVESEVKNNFTTDLISKCQSDMSLAQEGGLSSLDVTGAGSTVNFACNQEQAGNAMNECLNTDELGMKTLNTIAEKLDLKVDKTTEITNKAEIKSDTETSAISNLGLPGSGSLTSSISFSCSILIVILLGGGFFMMGGPAMMIGGTLFAENKKIEQLIALIVVLIIIYKCLPDKN